MNLGINASQAIGRAAGVITVELDDTHVDASVAAHSPDLQRRPLRAAPNRRQRMRA